MLHALLNPICCPPLITGFMVVPPKLKAAFASANPPRSAPDYFPLHAAMFDSPGSFKAQGDSGFI